MTAAGGERFFFHHMHKAAGTSLAIRLRRYFGNDAMFPYPEQRDARTANDVPTLRRVFAARSDQIRIVAGHFPYCVPELLGAPFSTFTVLRHPLPRTVSALAQVSEDNPDFRGMTLEEVYMQPFVRFGLVGNHLTRMLSLTPDAMPQGFLTPVWDYDGHLETAKRNLRGIDVVGVQEDLDELCGELERRFGWDLGRPLRVNRSRAVDVPDGLTEQILEDNAIDVQLYEYALTLIAERRESAAGADGAGAGGAPSPRGSATL